MGCQESTEVKKGTRVASPTANGHGAKLLDKYVLGQVLGQGAFGVVYKCTEKANPKKVFAVKMIDQVETSPVDIKKEIAMVKKLAHPCVIKMYDVYYEKVFVCMVLELYKGGDMIQGMMAHWKAKGMIPIPAARHLTKQMWEAIAYTHSKKCVHRDIKGDNFMMDLKDVGDTSNRIYLSDFGTVCEIAPGERLKQKCGTKNYWAPEVYKLDYSHKMDNWATGVVMFGLITGKFPFKGEEDVKNKVLSLPKRCPPDGAELINAVLEKSEAKRFEAKQALEHRFLADVPSVHQQGPEAAEEDGFKPDLKEMGANAGVQQRRADLVERLLKAQKGGANVGPFTGTLSLQASSDKGFVVVDKYGERTMEYEWWSPATAADVCDAWARAPKMKSTDITSAEFSGEDVQKMLAAHQISVDGFGKGKAKRFEEFVTEIQCGQSRLQLDASKHKHIVRVVDVVLLRLVHGEGAGKKYLIEMSEQFPDGRVRNGINQMPGDKKAPHENALQTAERLQERLNMTDCEIVLDFSGVEYFEHIEDSPSYPGVQTVYRKEVLTGKVTTTDPRILERIGATGRTGQFTFEDGAKYQKTCAWLSQSQCVAKQIQIGAQHEEGNFSTLVYPPCGLEEEELEEFLQSNKINTSMWGQGTARSLADFSEELVKGEATLEKKADGKIKRVVDVVIMQIARKSNNDVLIELKETHNKSSKFLKRLPAVKRRSDEHQFLAARRLITNFLRIDDHCVYIDTSSVKLVEEEKESVS